MKNKTYLIIFLFLFAFICIFSTDVKAMTFTDNNGNSYEVPDLPSDGEYFSSTHYFIYKNGSSFSMMTFIGFNEDTMKINLKNSRITILNAGSSYFNFWDLKNGVWTSRNVKYNSDTNYGYYAATGSNPILFSTVDVYYGDSAETLFFQKTPLEEEGVALVIPVEVAEIPEMIQKIVTILIRVGLIISGTLYVALVLSSRILRKT